MTNHLWGQRSCRDSRGQPEVKLIRNSFWPPNLVGRTLDQNIIHSLDQSHAGVIRGQPEVKLLTNAL